MVTLALIATGSTIGAVLGALSLLTATAVFGVGPQYPVFDLLAAGTQAGGLAGAILAPTSAWVLLKRVPLWKSIAEPALGTLLGSIASTIMASMIDGGLAWSILGGLAGFLIAVGRLRILYSTVLKPTGPLPAS